MDRIMKWSEQSVSALEESTQAKLMEVRGVTAVMGAPTKWHGGGGGGGGGVRQTFKFEMRIVFFVEICVHLSIKQINRCQHPGISIDSIRQ